MSLEGFQSELRREKSFFQKHLRIKQTPACNTNTSVSFTQSSRFQKAAAQVEHQAIVPGFICGCQTTENFAEEIKGGKENTGKVQTQASGFCCLSLPSPYCRITGLDKTGQL